MDDNQAETLCNAYEAGKKQHAKYVQDRLIDCKEPITDTISKLSIPTFATHSVTKNKDKEKLKNIKRDSTLVTQMFLSLRSRPDLDDADFFRFENQKTPPSLADSNGQMRTGKKSDILACLPISTENDRQGVTIKVILMVQL